MTSQQLEKKLKEVTRIDLPTVADAGSLRADYKPVDEVLLRDVQRIVEEERNVAELQRIRTITPAVSPNS